MRAQWQLTTSSWRKAARSTSDQLVFRGLYSNDRTAWGLAAHIFGIDERERKSQSGVFCALGV
jgi:hypothetical protein